MTPLAAAFAFLALLLGTALPARAADSAPAFDDAASYATEAGRRALLERIQSVGRRGFLYEVTRADGTQGGRKLFLYGTIHLGREGNEPFNGPVIAALRQSRRLALEADPSDASSTQRLALSLGQYDHGDGLHRHVPPELMARVAAFGERHRLQADQLARFKPWLLANMVALTDFASSGLDPSMGSEMYLTGFARGMKLPIVEIEGIEAQLRLLAELPDALQAAQLAEALDENASGDLRSQGQELFELWNRGDAAAGEALIAQMHADAAGKTFERYFIDTLIDDRNRSMADRAERYLDSAGNTFFAVGSLHLFGDAGLLREFARRGYRVTDLQATLAAR